MYKTISALGAVFAVVCVIIFQMAAHVPGAHGTAVLAEKSNVILGGQAAVLIPNDLSNAQHRILNSAYSIAKANGHINPELVQGVLLQESNAGGLKSYKVAGNQGDEYFGLMQLKRGAALDVLQANPDLYKKYKFQTRTDDELKANLILNESFNIEVGSKYLLLLQNRYGLRGRELVNAYNRGPGGVKAVDDSFHYARGAETKLALYKAKNK